MITVDAKKIKEIEKQLGSFKSKAPSVIYKSLNRAAENARTNASRKARETYEIKASTVRDTIKLIRANKSNLRAIVRSVGYRMGLIKFKVSPKNPRPQNPPKVLKAAVKKTGLKEVMGAFVANINGNKVFKRTTKSRLPIEQLFGPAVPQILGTENVRGYIESEALKTFDTRIEHEINRVMEAAR